MYDWTQHSDTQRHLIKTDLKNCVEMWIDKNRWCFMYRKKIIQKSVNINKTW